MGGWWQGGWTAPDFELEKMTLRVTEISGGLPPAGRRNAGRFTPAGRGNADCNEAVYPCRTGERRAFYPPARRGNADIGMWRFTPLPTRGTPGGLPPAGRGNAECNVAVYPLPDGGTPGGLPLPDGGTPIWNVAVYPLPGGGTPIWNVAVYPPAGRGHADLDCGGLRRLW